MNIFTPSPNSSRILPLYPANFSLSLASHCSAWIRGAVSLSGQLVNLRRLRDIRCLAMNGIHVSHPISPKLLPKEKFHTTNLWYAVFTGPARIGVCYNSFGCDILERSCIDTTHTVLGNNRTRRKLTCCHLQAVLDPVFRQTNL